MTTISPDKQALLRQRLQGRAAPARGIPRRPDGRAALSPAQHSMWVANQFLDSNALYGVPRVLRLAAGVDVERLRRALDALLARHEILRTSYPDPAEPYQQVHPPAPVPLRLVDLGAVPADRRFDEAMEVVRAEMDTPFDLAHGPVFRAVLVDNLLVLNTHHIATDDWSATLMLRELDALYGGAGPLAPLPTQYADYAHWQNQRLSDSRGQQLAYWRSALDGTPRMLELPTDRPRPATPSYSGDVVTCSIAPEISARVRELAAARGVTVYTVLLAAFAETLRHTSGQERFAVGSPLSGRTVAESEPLVGLFMNTVAMPLDLSGAPTFSELLGRAHESVLGALDHQDVTFEQVVAALGADRTPAHNPIYQVIYQCLEAGERVHELPALQAEPVRFPHWTAKVDLTLDAVNGPVTIDLALNFATDLFDRSTAERLLRRHFVNVVRHVVAHPDSAVDSAAVMGADELTTVVRDWNATATSYPSHCVHELFEQQVARAPDAVAIDAGETTVSYGDLNRRANQMAHYLRRAGVGADSLVAVCLEHSVDLFVALLGVLKAGGAYVPLDPGNPPERLGFIVEDADAALVLADGRTAAALPPSCRDRVVDLGREMTDIDGCPDTDPAPVATADSLVYVIYTSGSTGRPKGVMMPHGAVANYLTWAASTYGPEAAHGAPMLGSVAFDLAVTNFLVPLTSGKDVRLLDGNEPLEALAAVLQDGDDFSLLKATPGHLAALGEMLAPGSVHGVRTYVVGGDELRPTAVERWRAIAPGARVINEYGPTETVVGCSTYDVPAGADQVPIGRPIANTQLYVLDGQLQPVPIGAVGELYIGGDGVARGYLNRPGLTAERFLPDPFSPTPGARFYRTGDQARYRADGNLEFLGRNDDQVKIRGYRVELGEIEARLLGHPGVAEAVVSTLDGQLVAHVVSGAPPRDLQDHLRRDLPDYMVPDHIVVLDALPLSSGGKVDRKALPAPEVSRTGFVAPRTPIEAAIAEVWCGVLGLEAVGVHDDFFELGGHSLQVIRAVARLRPSLGAELSMRSIFDHRTIASLTASVDLSAVDEVIPASTELDAPLSLGQARLWFLHTLEPDDPVYNVVEAFRWDGPLDLERFEIAVSALVARHEVLRTRFVATDGVARAILDPAAPVPVRVHNGAIEVASLGARTIDLTNGPIFFVDVIRRAPDEHVVVLTTHHIVSDAWSVAILRSELESLYAGEALSPLPVQYGDYARWQRERLDGAGIAFWREHLAGAGVLELPTDRPRPAVQTSHGATVRFDVPADVVARVREISRDHDATAFMVLLAVYEILLSRWSGQSDFTIGIPLANRERPELEHVVGLFVNTLPLRVSCGGDPTFAELLATTRATALDVYAHQDVPFEQIVDELQPRRDLSRTPLFTTTFDVQNEAEAGVAGGTTAKFDLALQLRDSGDSLVGGIVFNTDLYDAGSIERTAGHFQNLLAAAVATPETPVSRLDLLGDEERARLRSWEEHTLDDVPAGCPHELFEAQVDRAGAAAAVVDGDESVSYADLDRWANQLAWRLRSVGVGPEVLVGIAVERGIAMVAGLLAIAKAGGAYVPLDPDYPQERLEFMLQDSGVEVLVTQAGLDLPVGGLTTVCVDDDLEPWPTERISDTGVVQDNAACVFYTSGSTGRPKGTVVTGRAIVARMAEPTFVDLTPDDVVGHVSTLSFDAATFEIWATFLAGAQLAIIPGDALVGTPLRGALRANRVSVVFSTTAVFNDMVRQDVGAYSSLRCVMFGGESASKEAVRSVLASPDCPTVKHVYGPTETTTFASCGPATLVGDAAPIGGPIGATGLYVLDAWGGPVPAGVAGELFIGGPGVARGYLGRPGLTAEKFVPDPFGAPGARLYRTGDSVRWLPGGTIEFLGRFDDQVKVRGFRVEPGEIEARLQSHPGVAQVMVMAREDTPGVKRLVAYVVPTEAGRAPSTSELRAHLRDVLPDYMVPAAFVALEALPLNPNGKVDRKALPAPSSARPDVDAGFVAPRSVTEGVLAAIWGEVLGVDEVGVHDDFFELGGDSILSIQVMAAARRAGLTVTPRQVFGNPSIAELAALVDAEGEPAAVEAPQGPVTGEVPLTPIQRWFVSLDCPRDHHNQSVRLRWSEPVDVEALRRALGALVAHHDQLRLRLRGDQQHIAPIEDHELLWIRDDLATAADEAHASLDLASGPVVRAALVRDELILVVHHMAVDVVSWNILVEDLEAAYRQVALPAKTTSYQQWARRLADHEVAVAGPPPAPPFPVDHEGPNAYGSTATVTATLDAAATETLLRGAHGAYRTRITDLLVAALAQTLAGYTGESTVALTLEGHGREPLFDDVDLSRTVGWFTSLWPLTVDVPADPGRVIAAVKEQLHGTPHNGIGYGIAGHGPTAAVSFNYLGQTPTRFCERDVASGHHIPLTERLAPLGSDTPPTGTRHHLVDITAAITEGRLQVRWTYSTNVHDDATIAGLADTYTENLAGLLDHATSGAGGVTPSDFPLAGLDQAELDRVLDGFDAREVEDIYPLSPLQAGMVFHSLFEPDSTDYFVQFVYALEAGFDVPALVRACEHVIDRHPILRTTFAWEDVPQPLQVVHRRRPIQLRELDEPADLVAHLAEERQRGFDLRTAPPHRFDLIRRDDGTGQLVWHNHHILLDAWSEQLVLAEVRAAYHAFRDTGAAPDLPDPVPYRRYVDWLQGHDPAEATARWQRMLADVPLPTPVAVLDPQRGDEPDDQPDDVESVVAEVPADVTERLQQVARQHRITVGSVMHAAWSLLLSRYGGGQDVVFGTTVAGRSGEWPGVERAVGLLINTLPVRVHVAADATVVDWLRHVHEQLVEVRDLEHSSLVDVQRLGHVAAGRRLFDTILMFENFPHAPRRDEGGLSETPSLTPDRTGYPLVLNANLHERLLVRLDYQPARVTAETAQRLVEHFRMLVDLLTAEPHRKVGDLAPLPAEERALVVEAFNDTAADVPADRCLHQLFEAQVDATPAATAVIADGASVSYRDLEAQANRLARYLIDLGVEPGTSVGICVERGLDMVVAILAVLKAGGAYLPLDPDYPAERLAFMVSDTEAPVVLTQARLVDRLPQAEGRLVCLDAEDEARRIAQFDATRPRSGVTPNHLAYSIYTSGSTGRPKGTLIRHGGIVNYVWWMTTTFPLVAGDTVLQLAGVSFDISVWEMFWPWSRGAAVVLARPDGYKDPQYIADVMEREAITSAHLVPSMLRALLPLAADRKLALRWLFASAESLPLDVLAVWEKASPDTTFVNMYGATEVSVDSTAWWCDSSTGRVLVGSPIANQQVYVLDPQGDPAPIGVPGEAFLGGASVGRGYLGRPGLTAARFVPDPFGEPGARLYRTGDLVRWVPGGQLEFLGRLDHQVKIRGFRVELGEVEARLAAHPGLDRAVVVAREDQPGQKRLVAYVVPQGAEAPTTSELRGHVRDVLPDYMVPAAFVVLEALPLNPNGKIDRAALPVPSGVRPDLDAGFVAPRSPTEAVLAGVWGEVLGVDRVGIHDDFFELGGDSILSIQVMAAARRAGLAVTPRQVFDHPRIADLGAAIDTGAGAVAIEAEQGTVFGEVPLTPIQRWFVSGDCPGDRYNQSIRLRWTEPVDASALRTALAALVAHHDALRLRLRGESQHIAAVEDHELLWIRDDLVAAADEANGSLDLAAGPVVRAVLVGDELILVVHHMAVDVVSWNILVEDLEAAYQQSALPAKTTSYQQWARRLADYATSDEFAAEAAWWRAPRPVPAAFPVDHDRGPNTYGSTATVTTTVDVGAHRGRIGDLLVAALARTLAGHTGEPSVAITLEGHGREPLFDDVDLSRTVGWFTSLWPFTIRVPDDPVRLVAEVKEHLHSTPHNGIGHGIAHADGPTPAVSFNYLGRSAATPPFCGRDVARGRHIPVTERLGGIGSHSRGTATRPHLIDVTAAIVDGELQVHWTYSTNVHDESTITALADTYLTEIETLRTLIGAPVSQFQIDRLFPGAPSLQLALQRHKVPGIGVAVVADGELVDAWGEGVADAVSGAPVRPDTVFQVGSISKHVTALAAVRLAGEGRLDLDDDVNRYLRTWQLTPADPQRPVTLRHLLSHDAGVSADQFASFGGYAPDGPFPSVLAMLEGRPPAVTDPVRCEHPAGQRFRYSGNNYVVVEQVLVDLTGQPFPELMRELVFDPLGMTDSGYGPELVRRRGDAVAAAHDRDGRVVDGGLRWLPSATGGLWASAADLGRIAAELWRASNGNGAVVLDRQAAGELLTPIRPGVAYGLGTVVRTVDGVRWVGHTGDAFGYQCHTALALEPGLGLVIATNGDAGMELVVDVLVELGLGLHVWTAREE